MCPVPFEALQGTNYACLISKLSVYNIPSSIILRSTVLTRHEPRTSMWVLCGSAVHPLSSACKIWKIYARRSAISFLRTLYGLDRTTPLYPGPQASLPLSSSIELTEARHGGHQLGCASAAVYMLRSAERM